MYSKRGMKAILIYAYIRNGENEMKAIILDHTKFQKHYY